VFVLFGATGDLAKRMVLPAFYRLAIEGLLPKNWLLVGNGRGDVAHEHPAPHCNSRKEPPTSRWPMIRTRTRFRPTSG